MPDEWIIVICENCKNESELIVPWSNPAWQCPYCQHRNELEEKTWACS